LSEAVCTNLPENCSYAREGRRFRAVGGHTVCPECGSRAMVLAQSRIKLSVDVPGLTAPKRTRRTEPPPPKPSGRYVKPASAEVTAPTVAAVAPVSAADNASESSVAAAPGATPAAPAPADAPAASAITAPPNAASPPRKPPPKPPQPTPAADKARRRPNALQISALVLLGCIALLWLTMHRRLQSSPPTAPSAQGAPQNGLTVESAPETKPAPAAEPSQTSTDNAAADNNFEAAPPALRAQPTPAPSAPASETSPLPDAATPVRRTPVVRGPTWERRPTAEEIAQFYPEAASEAGQGGRVTLRCRVTREGALVACEIAAEDPPGLGFGEAALRMTRLFRMTPKIVDGQAVDGAPISVPIAFEPDH